MTEEEAAEAIDTLVREGHLRYWCSCACTLSDHAVSREVAQRIADKGYAYDG